MVVSAVTAWKEHLFSPMWNRKKDEEFTPPKPVATPPAPVESRKETIPKKDPAPPISASPPPARMADPYPELPRATASLGKSVLVKGQITSREDLTIDGEVEGTIELHDNRLTVGPNGKVTANIKAREIIVLGQVNGNMDVTDKIDIRKEARLVGDIKSARVVIEDGAYFKGSIDIVKVEPPKHQAPKQQQQAPPPMPQQAPPPAPTPAAASSHSEKR